MEITGNVIMWAFGLCVATVGAMATLLWRMLLWRIERIEREAHEDRKSMKTTNERIFIKLDGLSQDMAVLKSKDD